MASAEAAQKVRGNEHAGHLAGEAAATVQRLDAADQEEADRASEFHCRVAVAMGALRACPPQTRDATVMEAMEAPPLSPDVGTERGVRQRAPRGRLQPSRPQRGRRGGAPDAHVGGSCCDRDGTRDFEGAQRRHRRVGHLVRGLWREGRQDGCCGCAGAATARGAAGWLAALAATRRRRHPTTGVVPSRGRCRSEVRRRRPCRRPRNDARQGRGDKATAAAGRTAHEYGAMGAPRVIGYTSGHKDGLERLGPGGICAPNDVPKRGVFVSLSLNFAVSLPLSLCLSVCLCLCMAAHMHWPIFSVRLGFRGSEMTCGCTKGPTERARLECGVLRVSSRPCPVLGRRALLAGPYAASSRAVFIAGRPFHLFRPPAPVPRTTRVCVCERERERWGPQWVWKSRSASESRQPESARDRRSEIAEFSEEVRDRAVHVQ